MNLPVVERTEFGASRTVCACPQCTLPCRHMPGFLIPDDLERMVPVGQDVFGWAEENLLASPGALVSKDGKQFRIPTLVPARSAAGACVFLKDARCSIHAVSPFGCAFFSVCKPRDRAADELSAAGLRAVMTAWPRGGLYAKVWAHLNMQGLDAPAPEVCRATMRDVLA